ncbi:MAG: DUF134 domain-containing protein [Bacteroidia bacterium]|nr:DUF134 domain-containing protein [Bacteroidia bacterium]
MPRPKRIRRMNNPPHFKGFSPIGLTEENLPVIINFEEYEAIRLSDFELHGHVEAAQIMGISRPTYTRIYESARRKVAEAFVLGKTIVFEGGKVYFDSEWYSCNNCGCWFNHPEKEQEIKNCTLCGSTDIEQYKETSQQITTENIYICPTCGYEKMHLTGSPCQKEICPTCNCLMILKGTPLDHKMKNKNCN